MADPRPRREYRCLAFTMWGQVQEVDGVWSAKIWVSEQPDSVAVGLLQDSEVRRMPDQHMPSYFFRCDSAHEACAALDSVWEHVVCAVRHQARTSPQLREVT